MPRTNFLVQWDKSKQQLKLSAHGTFAVAVVAFVVLAGLALYKVL